MRKRIFPPLFSGGAAPWYQSGGAPAPVAVYKAIGALSAAASYVNLANPGTYDLTVASAPTTPAFNTATGWTFVAANGSRLLTGITPVNSQARTVLIRFTMTDFTADHALFGERNSNLFHLYTTADNKDAYWNGGTTKVDRLTSGVLGIAGSNMYIDGVDNGDIGTSTYLANATIMIGCYNNGGTPQKFHTGTILAFAYYDSTLTPAQVLAVSTAMAALA